MLVVVVVFGGSQLPSLHGEHPGWIIPQARIVSAASPVP